MAEFWIWPAYSHSQVYSWNNGNIGNWRNFDFDLRILSYKTHRNNWNLGNWRNFESEQYILTAKSMAGIIGILVIEGILILSKEFWVTEVRMRIMSEIKSLCNKSRSRPDFESIVADRIKLCQFILDPTSLNLPSRICSNEPNFFRKSRDLCFSIHNKRMDILRKKKELAVTKWYSSLKSLVTHIVKVWMTEMYLKGK